MLDIDRLSAGILQQVSFQGATASCSAILGPSGAGKTTLLNAIAGVIPYQGSVRFGQQTLDGLPSWQRPCRYLNQRLYLFPYLTVEGNLKLAQYGAGQRRAAGPRRELMQRLGIAHLARRYPQQISGGEQQRAALARALIGRPALLLLDEPFSSLDWETRTRLWQVLREIHRLFAVTILLVTHEPREADALADSQWSLQRGVLRRL
ncbi:ATP-binding cassette domain-containing protein [Sodalis sp. dw_96]|uniref:ABC transporter ATP-binding protein n=1 Tax=Sodalis sp. dw_96 TaxID=2719794 RepID=UPI001BD358F5|nr:ATP-binding cassette domain-containing protein [Sodalis sp. dw_96]